MMGDVKKMVGGSGHVDAVTANQIQRAFDMWLKDNPEIKEEIDRIARKAGLEPWYPTWLFRVPEKDQFNAARRHMQNVVAREERKAKLRQVVKDDKLIIWAQERVVTEAIFSAGYNLTYMYFMGYVIALAYKSSGKPNEMFVYFAICTPEDVWGNRRWKHGSRERLLDRIGSDDDRHSFACLIQGQGSMEARILSQFIRRRFIEYATLTDKGLPYPLKKGIQWAGGEAFKVPPRVYQEVPRIVKGARHGIDKRFFKKIAKKKKPSRVHNF